MKVTVFIDLQAFNGTDGKPSVSVSLTPLAMYGDTERYAVEIEVPPHKAFKSATLPNSAVKSIERVDVTEITEN